jgi:hypothetical protein
VGAADPVDPSQQRGRSVGCARSGPVARPSRRCRRSPSTRRCGCCARSSTRCRSTSSPSAATRSVEVAPRRSFPIPGCIMGASPIRQHALTIGGGLSAEQFGAQFFVDGGHPTAIFQNKTKTLDANKTAHDQGAVHGGPARQPRADRAGRGLGLQADPDQPLDSSSSRPAATPRRVRADLRPRDAGDPRLRDRRLDDLRQHRAARARPADVHPRPVAGPHGAAALRAAARTRST